MKTNWTRYAAIAGLVMGLAVPAAAQQTSERPATQADDKAREATASTGEKITDAWILTKVKAQFIGEDALEDSDINVDVRNNVVILKGTVASAAGKARAEQIARTTEGVTRVDNRLTIGMASHDDDDVDADDAAAGAAAGAAATAREAGREAKEESKEAGREMKDAARDAKDEAKSETAEAREEAREAEDEVKSETAEARREGREAAAEAKDEAREAREETGEAVGTAGQAVNDGWITTKVKGSFVGVDVLDGSDIDVDTKNQVVTLTGTVPTTAARARAEEIARKIEGVTSVKNELKVAPNQQ
jgi:hyperosmotically inducible periplasmic protein